MINTGLKWVIKALALVFYVLFLFIDIALMIVIAITMLIWSGFSFLTVFCLGVFNED